MIFCKFPILFIVVITPVDLSDNRCFWATFSSSCPVVQYGPYSTLTLTYIEDLLTSARKASNRQVRVFVAHRDVECTSDCDVRISVVVAYRYRSIGALSRRRSNDGMDFAPTTLDGRLFHWSVHLRGNECSRILILEAWSNLFDL